MTGDALLTDRYEISMLLGYVRNGLARRRATCELFVRRLPASRPFLVTAGLERAVRKLLGLRFAREEIEYLARDPLLSPALTPEALRAIEDFRFRGDLHAMPEGTVAFADEPLLRIEAALPEAQLVETLLLSIFNHDMRVATKAARVVLAAGARPCFEFGSRRTHEQAAVDAARAAYLAGFASTSNEAAGRRYGVPVSGTCAHMWVLAFAEEGEEEAFRAFAATFPYKTTFLVDTYDTLRGVDRAIASVRPAIGGVRLDSGDLAALSREVRARLDRAGLTHARIVASGDLDEYAIKALDGRGACVDAFGVGTKVVASPDAASLGAIYKLVAVEGKSGAVHPVAKLSSGKATHPGAKQVFRTRRGGRLAGDEIALAGETRPGTRALLVPYVRDGEPVAELPALEAVRAHALDEIAALPDELKEIPEAEDEAPGEARYPVVFSPALQALLRETEAAEEARA